MITFTRFKDHSKKLSYLSIFHSCLVFAFAIALLVKWEIFGSNPECNSEAVVVIFRSFSAIHAGRKAGWATVIIALVLYTCLIIGTYKRALQSSWKRFSGLETNWSSEKANEDVSHLTCPCLLNSKSDRAFTGKPDSDPDFEISARILMQIIFILVLLPLAIVNTELLIKKNKFAPDNGLRAQWAFGQVMLPSYAFLVNGTDTFGTQVIPVFLIVHPLVNVLKAFKKYGLRSRKLYAMNSRAYMDDSADDGPVEMKS